MEESWMPAPSYFHVKTPCFKSKNCNFRRTVWHCMLKYTYWPLCHVQLVSRGWTPSLRNCLCGTDSTRSSNILVSDVNVWVQHVSKVLHWFQIWWLWRPCEYTELIVVVIKKQQRWALWHDVLLKAVHQQPEQLIQDGWIYAFMLFIPNS